MKAYRQRVRANPTNFEQKKNADKERKRLARIEQKTNVLKMTPSARKRHLEKERFLESERKRKHRQNKSQNNNGGEGAALDLTPKKVYKSRQAAGKAMQRLRVCLPFSPSKRKAVTLQLALEAGNSLSRKVAKQNSKKSVSQEVIDKVSEFYSSDDISWAAPGLRDGSIVKANGSKKTVIQKRYLTMNIMEAYQLFKTGNPEVQLGKSRFFDFRPKHVQVMANIPHNVCICKVHGNIDSLLEGLSKVFPECPRSGRSLIEAQVCQRKSDKCMLGACMICANNQFTLNLSNDDESEDEMSIKWRRWEDVMGRPAQVDVSLAPVDAVAQINFLIPEYKTHCLIKDEQSNMFKESKTDIQPKCAILQIDFAENYAATCQDEVQSAHWNHQQVTVFTAVAWLQTSCQSFTVVSDDTDHDKVAVWAMLKVIIKSLKDEYSINNVKIFSDGCAAQFKNKYTMANLCFMEEDFNVHCEWAFFASSHGKGSVDAVGGTVKRNVWRAVKGRKVIVNNAEMFYKVHSCSMFLTKDHNFLN